MLSDHNYKKVMHDVQIKKEFYCLHFLHTKHYIVAEHFLKNKEPYNFRYYL